MSGPPVIEEFSKHINWRHGKADFRNKRIDVLLTYDQIQLIADVMRGIKEAEDARPDAGYMTVHGAMLHLTHEGEEDPDMPTTVTIERDGDYWSAWITQGKSPA